MLMLVRFLRSPARSDVSKIGRCVQIQLSLCLVDGNSLLNYLLPELSCACTDVEDPQAHGA
eukprot:2017318-Karenia_brevis.AAC.1